MPPGPSMVEVARRRHRLSRLRVSRVDLSPRRDLCWLLFLDRSGSDPAGRLVEENGDLRVVYVLVIHLPADGVESFQRYEAAVLPLLADHHGRLDRRLRSVDERTGVHLVSFPSADHFESYRNDPRRAEQSHLLDKAHARLELYELIDVA